MAWRINVFLCFGVFFLSLIPKSHAQMVFPERTLNLGTIKSGKPVSCAFPIFNKSDEALTLKSLRGSCGCVVTQGNGKVLKPGQTGSLPVELVTLGQSPGSHRWYVFVRYLLGKEEREATLEVKAHLDCEVTVKPSSLLFHLSQPQEQTLFLIDWRAHPLNIVKLQTSSPFLQCHIRPQSKASVGKKEFSLSLQISDKFPEGRHEEYLHIYTDDPFYDCLKVPLTIVKYSPSRLSTTPKILEFRGFLGRPIASRLLLVRDSKEEAITISKIETDHPAIKVRWAKGPGTLATVRVCIDEKQLHSRSLTSTIQIQLTQPVKKTLVVPLRLQIAE